MSFCALYFGLLKLLIYSKYCEDYIELNCSYCFQCNIGDWSRCALTFKVYQTMFRMMRESENVDERQHCFLAQSPGKPPRYLSVETRQELLRVEAAWHTAICSAITHLKVRRDARAFQSKGIFGVIILSHVFLFSLQSKTFPVTFNSRSAGLTLEWTQGFTLSYEGIGEIAWRYKFSQLRGSSDDGKSRLKLHFQEPDSIAIETKVNNKFFETERFIATQWFNLFSSQEIIISQLED